MLDDLLLEADLKMQDKILYEGKVLLSTVRVGITIDITSVDGLLWTIYNLVTGLDGEHEDNLKKVLTTLEFGSMSIRGLANTVLKLISFGDIQSLNVDALGDQNANSRKCRNWPVKSGVVGSSDIEVLAMLTQFLSDNRAIFKKVTTSTLSFGTLDDTIKGINDTVKSLLTNFTGFLKDTLYGLLWNTDADTAPEGFDYDTYIQKLVDWALIEGTGEVADNGGKSILGADFSAFLPAMKTSGNGKGASISDQSVYGLVNNAIQALLSGTVSDLLKNLLINLLDIDASANGGKGNKEAMNNQIFSIVVGAIKELCEQNGAPTITFSEDGETYPIPRIEELLNWFFVGGGLSTFVTIEEGKIGLTDNFMSLLGDLIRKVPSILPLLSIEVPDSIKLKNGAIEAKVPADEILGKIYQTVQGEDIYSGYTADGTPIYCYVIDGTIVNTTETERSDYRNPTFIREKYEMSNNEVYGYILKIVLNSLIDGCYFPEWATTVAEVGAYGLASLAARFLPENDYFDRLNAYHYQQIGEDYTAQGAVGSVTPLAYTEQITLNKTDGTTTTVTVPRAAADIGASIGAYFLNGVFPVSEGLSSKYGTSNFETDTTFETFVFEFLVWGVRKYMPAFVGTFDEAQDKFVSTGIYSNFSSEWQSEINEQWAKFAANIQAHDGKVSEITSEEMRSALFTLIDNTLFVVFPTNMLPDWLATFNSGSEALIYYWLGDSVTNFDLQQLLSLFQSNSTGELNQSLRTFLLRLIDRLLGMIFGGNAILPTASETNNRSVFDLSTPTSINTFEDLLGNGDNLGTFLSMLLYELNVYIKPLAETLFPFFGTVAVKNAAYTDKDGVYHDYIGSNTITVDNLETYVKELDEDQNYILFSGDKLFSSKAKAEKVAEEIGLTNYSTADHQTTDDGAVRYAVPFPTSYGSLKSANAAENYAKELLDSTFTIKSERDGLNTTYYLYEKIDYRTTSAKESVSYTYVDGTDTVDTTTYTYTDFSTAKIIKGNDGSNRSGSKGEVKYETGKYKALYTEDYSTSANGIYLRLSSSLSDATDYVDEFHKYAEETLPNAYGDWLMYYVKMQLFTSNLYDRNDDGTYTVAEDTNPSTPSSPYPFTASSGYSTKQSYAGDTNYNFADTANEQVVLAALQYASNSENDVTLSLFDAENVVRLALNTMAFDITKGSDGSYNNGSKQWTDLTDEEKEKITALCNKLGLTFNYDGENSTITRKAFALFTSTMNGSNVFGNYCTYKTDTESGKITSVDKTVSVPLTPYTLKKQHSSEDNTENNSVEQQIWESYIDFAGDSKDYTEGLEKHYDDISWRAANLNTNSNTTPDLTTIKFVVALTAKAYNPQGIGVNKVYDTKDTSRKISKYTTESFKNFQRAYEYAQQLIAKKDGIRQSLVTVAYRTLLEAYSNLQLFGGLADWTNLASYMDQAKGILDSDLGVDENGTVKNPEIGYTQESLTNLVAAYKSAKNLYDTGYTTYDTDQQDKVDNEALDLLSVLNALVFPEGVSPDIKVKSDYVGTVTTTQLPKANVNSTQLGIISGLKEGEGFTKKIQELSLYVSGFRIDGVANKEEVKDSGYGNGTGSYYLARNINTGEVVRYYAVVLGDLNGDTRIDSNDKLILEMYMAESTENINEDYIKAASDVNCDNSIDLNDLAKIRAHYTYSAQAGESGSVDGTIVQTSPIVIVGQN